MKGRYCEEVLDHGYVVLRNIAGPVRRADQDFDADDTDPANAARFSFDGADQKGRTREDDLKLDRYLLKNGHTTPFEMIVVWLEMKMPIFVARQFVRHRTASINEVSARYSVLSDEFYIPELKNIGVKSESNKQGRDISKTPEDVVSAEYFRRRLSESSADAYDRYRQAIKNGIPNELARCFLPVNIYTKWLWKMDLHNLFHFLGLRIHSHAQYEARCYGDAIYDILSDVLPHSAVLFDQYRRKPE